MKLRSKSIASVACGTLLGALAILLGAVPDRERKEGSSGQRAARPAVLMVSAGTDLEERLTRAGRWMATFPEELLRFDAAVGLSGIVKQIELPEFSRELERVLRRANTDDDNPMRRLWDPSQVARAEVTRGWRVPGAREPRANVNRVVIEALFCAQNGWRGRTQHYIVSRMRDAGGYHSTHALWALVIARQNGCLSQKSFAQLASPLENEIYAAQPEAFNPGSTLDIDLYAERMLVLLLSEFRDPKLARWSETLVRIQNKDGSWGMPLDGEPPYYQYHATMVTVWALSIWRGRVPRSW